jgi:hypothetical protein
MKQKEKKKQVVEANSLRLIPSSPAMATRKHKGRQKGKALF